MIDDDYIHYVVPNKQFYHWFLGLRDVKDLHNHDSDECAYSHSID